MPHSLLLAGQSPVLDNSTQNTLQCLWMIHAVQISSHTMDLAQAQASEAEARAQHMLATQAQHIEQLESKCATLECNLQQLDKMDTM